MVNTLLIVAYIIFGIAVAIALIFPIVRMISNPKQAVKVLLILAGIFVLGFISYLLSSNDFTPLQLEKLRTTESISVWVGAGLNLTYIVGIGAVLAALFLAVKKSILK